MTPFARSIFLGKCNVDADCLPATNMLHECQFFELSDVFDIASDLAWRVAYGNAELTGDFCFLPSEPCALEWKNDAGQNFLFLLYRRKDKIIMRSVFGYKKGWVAPYLDTDLFSERATGSIVPKLEAWSCTKDEEGGAPSAQRLDLFDRAMAAIFLEFINRPEVVGRRQHMPDQRLERALLKGRVNIGKFPLRAWTEIQLNVNRTTHDASMLPSREAHLSGKRPMHFCRAHLRLQLGRVVLVRGHWRGDASVGVKRSRYKVLAGERSCTTAT